MTKTKRQLRAEAVERLNNWPVDAKAGPLLDTVLGKAYDPYDYEKDLVALIDLLQDEEPPEGDAVAILRKAARCTSVNTSVGDVLRYNVPGNEPSAWQTAEDACEALADMIERDYVPRWRFDELADAYETMADLSANQAAELNAITAERDELKAINDGLQVALDAVEGCDERCRKLEAERERWRECCSKMLDVASEIQRVADTDD